MATPGGSLLKEEIETVFQEILGLASQVKGIKFPTL